MNYTRAGLGTDIVPVRVSKKLLLVVRKTVALAAFFAISVLGGTELRALEPEGRPVLPSVSGESEEIAIPDIPPVQEKLVPENFVSEPVFFPKGDGVGVDTLDIGDGFLQIVLRDDHTWYYTKNFSKMAESDVFTGHWSENVVNPYNDVKESDLPYRSSICLADSASSFVCPYVTKVYSKFGYRYGRRHQGVDLPLAMGTPVKAAFDGRVRLSAYVSGYGNLIIIRHENGLETFYGHLSKRLVKAGDWISAGQEIGLGGSTGRSSGPHLHFETRYLGFAFDPQRIFDFETGDLRANVLVLRRSHLDPGSRYVPTSIEEEDEIYATDEQIIAEEMRIAAEKAAMKWHTVRSGDTVSGIAAKYGKTQKQIVSLNPGLNVNKIRIGQKIRVN